MAIEQSIDGLTAAINRLASLVESNPEVTGKPVIEQQPDAPVQTEVAEFEPTGWRDKSGKNFGIAKTAEEYAAAEAKHTGVFKITEASVADLEEQKVAAKAAAADERKRKAAEKKQAAEEQKVTEEQASKTEKAVPEITNEELAASARAFLAIDNDAEARAARKDLVRQFSQRAGVGKVTEVKGAPQRALMKEIFERLVGGENITADGVSFSELVIEPEADAGQEDDDLV